MNDRPPRIWADFNGLFDDVPCLSHRETCRDELGNDVEVREGQRVMAFDRDVDENDQPDDLIATGTVGRPPDWLKHTGSRWVLLIDEHGVRHGSELGRDPT